MENNLSSNKSVTGLDAGQLLESVQSDRAGLSKRLREPRWFSLAFGMLAAAFISTAVWEEAVTRGTILIVLVVVSIFLLNQFRKETGMRLRGFRLRESVLFATALVATLLLFSVSLGLAASGLLWWIALPVVTGFIVVAILTRSGVSSMQERLRNVL